MSLIHNAKPLPSKDYLESAFDVDFEEGKLTWKVRPVEHFSSSSKRTARHVCNLFNSKYAGKPALNYINSHGYFSGAIDGQFVRAHRVIWKMKYGFDAMVIDHINRVRTDNRIVNLRSTDLAGNAANRVVSYREGFGGGVYFHPRESKWKSRLHFRGKKINIGSFFTKEEGEAARLALIDKISREFGVPLES